MSVVALKPYAFAARDVRAKFPAPLLYIGWEDHMMPCAPFCAPFPPVMKFGDLVKGALPGFYGAHPEFARIDWDKVEWFRSGQPWKPDMDKSLADNGLEHKSVIRFRTPGLTGLSGSAH